MIKIRFRKNLLYLFIYYISAFIDYTIIGTIIYIYFRFNPIYACIYLYPFENIIGGLIVYLYQRNSVKKNGGIKYFGIDINHDKKSKIIDGKCKKILLIFIASYLNYYNIIIRTFYFLDYVPWSMDLRISSIQIISSALICAFSFDFGIKKHHKVSLIIISIFLFLSICLDMFFIVIYKYKNIRIPIFQYFISLYYHVGFSINNCIEKYLVDINYMNPFIILLSEGIFQFIMSVFVPIWGDPFKVFKESNIKNNLALFIILLILYVLFQIVVNIYRIYCNVIYSPMARSLIDYFFNPFINIFFYFVEHDFFNNTIYFVVTEVFCLVMSFFGCVFNEYIVLYCCDLELETQDEIADRAKIQVIENPVTSSELKTINESQSYESSLNDNSIKTGKTICSINTDYYIKM